jgi:sulfofructose kinase
LAARVLCVGVLVLDNIFAVERFSPEPTKVFATEFRQISGGPAANAAATVAKLGGAATLWARVGEDAIGGNLIRELAECGIDTGFVRQIAGRRTGVSSIVVDGDGDRAITAFADRTLDTDPSWLPLDRVADFNAVMCDVRWPRAAEQVLLAAKAAGVTTVLDADLTTDDAVARLMPLADYTVFSAPALTALTGDPEPRAALLAARELTRGRVAVTLGVQGFAWLEGGSWQRSPAFQVRAVDTLAAGDVFHGAFALGIAEGMAIDEAGRLAAGAAALKCTRWGGRAGIPDREELEEFLLRGNVAAPA